MHRRLPRAPQRSLEESASHCYSILDRVVIDDQGQVEIYHYSCWVASSDTSKLGHCISIEILYASGYALWALVRQDVLWDLALLVFCVRQ